MGQTIIGDAYWSSADQPFSTWPDGWTMLGDEVAVTFTIPEETATELRKAFEGMGQLSDAAIMDEWIRESHRMPDIRNTKLLRDMNVTNFGMRFNRMGYYEVTYLDFADGSSYEHNVVYD